MIRRFFQSEVSSKLVDDGFQQITDMLKRSREMLDHSLAALLDNQPLTVDLEQLDDAVDEGERSVRRTVLEHLAVNPKNELVASLLLVSVVQDAERVGDFARGIAELVPLARQPREGEFAEKLRRLSDRLGPMFSDTITALENDDPATARTVMETARHTKAQLIAYTADVAASDLGADMAVVYSSSARILRRIGAHLSNICSSVVQPFDRIRHDDEDV